MNFRFSFLCLTALVSIIGLNATQPQAQPKVLFSPYDKPATTLIGLINQAKTSISAAIYMFTDKNVAQALAAAKKRGVDVVAVVDQVSTGQYGKVDILNAANIPVYIFDPKTPINPQGKSSALAKNTKHSACAKAQTEKKDDRDGDRWFSNAAIMHNKFMILDGVVLWTGSFNWTNAANTKNCENAIYMVNPELCESYQFYFDTVRSERCTVYNGPAEKTKKKLSLKADVVTALKSSKTDDDLASKLVELFQKHKIPLVA